MSLNVGRVCASCGKPSSGVSISCTECLQDGQATTKSTAAAERAADQEVCLLHRRKQNLYCLNCSEGVCGDCIDLGEPHELHQVCNLAAMYLKKASKFEVKLIRAEKINNELHAGTAVYRRNLELVENVEDLVLKEIETMTANSKRELFRVSNIRKEVLKERLNIPTVNGKTLGDLRSKSKQLSPCEFLKQLPDSENKCDELIAQETKVALQKSDDIHCDLVPQYLFTETVYPGFQNAALDNVHVTHLKAAHDIEWKFTMKKADMLKVEPKTCDPEIVKFQHMLDVTISHPDYTKTINQSFKLNEQHNKFDVVHSSYLVEQGFCNEVSGDLAIRIGIRCLNVLVEKQLLNYQYCLVRNRFVMHFYPTLSDVSIGKELNSWRLREDKKRCWNLMVQLKSEYVGCHVALKHGPSVYSDFFIELKNTDPMKTIIRRIDKHNFDTETDWGWSYFIKLDTLKNDAGYHPDGNLHFRFGVRPLPSPAKPAKPSAPSAANA